MVAAATSVSWGGGIFGGGGGIPLSIPVGVVRFGVGGSDIARVAEMALGGNRESPHGLRGACRALGEFR